jgi:hypothetical protein
MYLLNITIICSYCGDAMKEMNRGIRSFFLFTIYTIQLWNRVRFCFFKSFTERRRCHTNNTYIQRINIYTLLTQNHSDVRLEGHLIFRDFIEFERKKNTGTRRSTWLNKTTTSVKIYIDHFNKEIYFRSRKRRNHFEDKQCQTVIRKDRGRWVFTKLWERVI